MNGHICLAPGNAAHDMSLLFVYGSLKEGFPNFHVNKGRRIPGEFRTAQPYPFYLINGTLPCLIPTPGVGHHVVGQLFEVSESDLAAIDALERVGEPGGFARITVEVEPADGSVGDRVTAMVFVQPESRLSPTGTHIGPIAVYTYEHAGTLSW